MKAPPKLSVGPLDPLARYDWVRLDDAAELWASAGFHPVELYGLDGQGSCACGRTDRHLEGRGAGKHPVAAGWQTAALDMPALLERFRHNETPRNLGLRMGVQPGGERLLAVDDDGGLEAFEAKHGALPGTLTLASGGGGKHRLFRVPFDVPFKNSVRVDGLAVDLRCDRGQIVVAPSQHASGSRYSIAELLPVADLPSRFVELLRDKPPPSPTQPPPATLSLAATLGALANQAARALAYCQAKAKADPSIQGSDGSAALARWAGAVFWKLGLNEAEGLPLLREMSSIGATPPWSDSELRHAMHSGMRPHPSRPEPRGHLLAEWAAADELQAQRRGGPRTPAEASEASETYDWIDEMNEHAATEDEAQPSAPAGRKDAPRKRRASTGERRTDLGNARRLIRLHGHELRHFPARKTWLVWDGARWLADETGEVVRRAKESVESMFDEASQLPEQQRTDARKWALSCQNQKRIGPMIALASTEPGVPVTAAELDADPWLLNTQSGVLDLRTGTLSPPDPSKLMTKLCAARYVAGARSELWDRTVSMLFGDDHELRDYVQRAMGYAVFGAWREKALWFGYGPPDGGKSTFLGVIGDVLGDYCASADATTWMAQQYGGGGNRGDLTRLMGARLVTSVEVRANARFDEQLMKKVTGGDPLTYAAKFEKEIQFSPTFALWFGANDRPAIPDEDEGFWGRVRCVPFTRVVAKADQDPALREKLASPEHSPAVLAWLVEGCAAWQARGIGSCSAVERATAEYRRDNNLAFGFAEDCLEYGPDKFARCSDVRNAYLTWAKDNGVRFPMAAKQLGARLRQLGAGGGDDSSRISGHRVWTGIGLTTSVTGWPKGQSASTCQQTPIFPTEAKSPLGGEGWEFGGLLASAGKGVS